MPQSAFDGAAGQDTYEPEKVIAERLAKGVTQYFTRSSGPATMRSTIRGSRSSMLKKMKAEPAADAATAKAERDELEEYLAEPEEEDLDMKVLAWWQAREGRWPNLAKMVKQYFASPASSAGVERVFSAAGKMHSDLKKSSKDDTLEASLFAMQNMD